MNTIVSLTSEYQSYLVHAAQFLKNNFEVTSLQKLFTKDEAVQLLKELPLKDETLHVAKKVRILETF